jgi:hypothetical protein
VVEHDDIGDEEVSRKAAWWVTACVNARLAALFPATYAPEAARLLGALVGEVPGGDTEASDAASCRLMLAALKASEGDLARLALWVDAVRRDPRDLIAASEYRRELAASSPEARRADLAEYLAWVSGTHGR